MVAGIKEIDGAPVGDTITLENRPAATPLPGFKQIQPRVFAGLFPVNSEDYEKFRDALAKLRLNDSALHYEPEVSGALGFGFRCGFLGLLHMDIVQERLEREYELDARHQRADGGLRGGAHRRRDRATSTTRRSCRRSTRSRRSASRSSSPTSWCRPDYVGAVLGLCNDKRGVQKKMQYLGHARCRCSTSCRSPRWCSISSTA